MHLLWSRDVFSPACQQLLQHQALPCARGHRVCSQPSTCPYTLKPLRSPPAPCPPQAPSCCHSSWLAYRAHQAQPHSVSPSLLFALHPFLLLHTPFSHGELHRIPPSFISPAVPQHSCRFPPPPSFPSLTPREGPFTFSLPFSFSVSLEDVSLADVSLPPLPCCFSTPPWQDPGSAGSTALRCRQHFRWSAQGRALLRSAVRRTCLGYNADYMLCELYLGPQRNVCSFENSYFEWCICSWNSE